MNKFKLRELIDICNGTKYSHLKAGDVPLYGSGGVMSYVNDYLYDGEAILLPRKGTLSNIMYTIGKIWTVDTMYYATVKNDVDTYYLYSYLSILDLQHLDSGSTLPSMTKSAYQDIEVYLPSLDIQKKTTAVLSALDAKIELNNRINAELEAMAKTLYDYWFVQFDFPDENDKPYKSSGGKMVYNETLKREIPDGWKAKELGDIEGNIITGKTPPKKNPEYFEGNIPFITIGDIRGNMHIVSTEETLSKLGADFQRGKYLNRGAICVSCIASPGLVGFATELSQTNQQINSIECQKEEHRYYLYFAIKDFFIASKAKTGNTFPNMNKGDFSSIQMVSPDEDHLRKFMQKVKPSFELILNNTLQNQQLTQLRDWLLPMLMNGQVTVK